MDKFQIKVEYVLARARSMWINSPEIKAFQKSLWDAIIVKEKIWCEIVKLIIRS